MCLSICPVGYSQPLCAAVRGMLQKRPRQRATLPSLIATELLRGHARGGAPPPLLDVLEKKAKALGGTLIEGRGAARL